jgi:hypothetical protein
VLQVTKAVHDARTTESSFIQECDEQPDAFGEKQPIRCLPLFMVAHKRRRFDESPLTRTHGELRAGSEPPERRVFSGSGSPVSLVADGEQLARVT